MFLKEKDTRKNLKMLKKINQIMKIKKKIKMKIKKSKKKKSLSKLMESL